MDGQRRSKRVQISDCSDGEAETCIVHITRAERGRGDYIAGIYHEGAEGALRRNSRTTASPGAAKSSELLIRLTPRPAACALFYPKSPRFDAEKLARLGKIVARAEAGMPNQEHSVAPY